MNIKKLFSKKLESLESIFLKAIENRDVSKIKQCIKSGVDVNSKTEYQHTPLMFVCCLGTYEMAKILIDAGANINDKNCLNDTPMKIAKDWSKIEIARLLKGARKIQQFEKTMSKVDNFSFSV